MAFSIFNRPRQKRNSPRTEQGQRIYAIGDIHGRFDLLKLLMGMIVVDAGSSEKRQNVLITLGDYVDRGPSSDRVLDLLANSPPPGFQCHHLMGNHDEMLLDFIDGSTNVETFLRNGGKQTLACYGCDNPDDLEQCRQTLRANMPPAQLDFLRGLKTSHLEGDYVFVHAGLRPGVPLEGQSDQDKLWIRSDFLKSKEDFGKVVVHGHSIQYEPDIRDNRIGIDTGAWKSGTLTCLVLDGDQQKFLST